MHLITAKYLICKVCGEEKSIDGFYRENRSKCKTCLDAYRKEYARTHKEEQIKRSLKYRTEHKDHIKEVKRKEYDNNREYLLWRSARHRAKERGIEFNIEPSDVKIPELCPVLHTRIRLDGTTFDRLDSPSLDRIDATKGYIKGNVKVISVRANTIKSYGTIEEHQMVIQYMINNLKGG